MGNLKSIQRPIFIVGPGRSGTTLLRMRLSAHSRISITPETHFMKRANSNGLAEGRPADFDSFWRAYTSWVRFKDLGVDADHCLDLIMQQGHPTFENIFRAVLVAYGERTGKERVGEKSPSHVHYIPQLLDWFPDGQVLITQRDPRAVIASQLKTQYMRARLRPLSIRHGVFVGKRLYQLAYYADDWAKLYSTIVPAWESDPRVHIVRYEALVQQPEHQLRAICDFLEEDFEPSMLTTRSHQSVALPAGEEPDPRFEEWRREQQVKALRPLTTDSLETWKRELTEMETAMIEGRTACSMRKNGYVPSVSAAKRAVGRILAVTFLVGGSAEGRARDAVRSVWRRTPVMRKSRGDL